MRRGILEIIVILVVMGYTGCAIPPSHPASTAVSSPSPTETPLFWPTPTITTTLQPTLIATATLQPTTAVTALPVASPSPTTFPSVIVSPTPSPWPTATLLPTAISTPSAIPQPTTTSTPVPRPPQVHQVSLTIPTYQFADGLYDTLPGDPIYPYKRLDFSKVGPPQPQSYQALVLENEYVALTIVPELGGRVLRWVDKATGDTPFYANPVFKPTHWGYRGWWFATGGMEWAFPAEEHGLVEWQPWAYRISQEPMRTVVVVTDQEQSTGLELEIRISLETDSAAVHITPRIQNPLQEARSYQFWSNAIVALADNRASDELEFILPAEQVTVHSTGDADLPSPGQPFPWPIYQGRDLSRYRNWRTYLGIFVYPQAQADFMGAYDHSSNQGVVRVFPSSVARGVKVFGGKGLDPHLWTDDQSTYIELWGGVMPHFGETALLEPGEVLTWTETWYMISGLGGFNYADEKAALRLEVGSAQVTIGAATAHALEGELVLWQNGREAARWPVALQPSRGVVQTWSRSGADGARWKLQLLNSAGQIVTAWESAWD